MSRIRGATKMSIEKLNYELENMIGDSGIKVPGLGVIVYFDGKEVFSKFAGSRIVGDKPKPVTRDTRFRAASVSKMFTVFTIMQLVEQGKIHLNDDAGDYLGFSLRNPNFPDVPITIEMLASHLSSLRDGKIYSAPPDVSIREFFHSGGKFWENGVHFAPACESPGKFFTYCNLNYGILGTIIEVVTGERFDLHQREGILRQLDIRADYVPANLEREDFELLGAIYRKKNSDGVWDEFGDWFAQVDDFGEIQPERDTLSLQNPYDESFSKVCDLRNYCIGTNATFFSPQGGLRISFEELAHTLEMLMSDGSFHGEEILTFSSLSKMFKSRWIYDNGNGDTCGGTVLNYGMGIYSIDGKSSSRVFKNHEINFVGHVGQAFGLLSGLFFIPSTGSGFIYMMNGEAIQEDFDFRSFGIFSKNYIWEEKLMDAVCDFLIEKFYL
ncbi:MAG: beta-lactamase family protein [Selenomonadaceae bacterium]|nr:beta-lactamase family protein [Selenomonadaceae bacterium]